MQARLAQVVYTITQFPTVKGVVFSLDGEPIDVLGGEGIIIDQPLTRRDYAEPSCRPSSSRALRSTRPSRAPC